MAKYRNKFINLLVENETRTIYWKDDINEAVFRRTPKGEQFTKFKGESEFRSDNSDMARDAFIEQTIEITKEQYEKY